MYVTIPADVKLDNGEETYEHIQMDELVDDKIDIIIPSLKAQISIDAKDFLDAIKVAHLRGRGLL